VIAVRDVVFDYAGRRALRGVSLDVARGSITALVGPNGAGKTTLLRCMAGLQYPLAGTVRVGGVSVIDNRRESHRLLGYLSDFFGVYESLSAAQCLHYMALAHGMRGDEAVRAAARAAQRVEITDHLHARAGTLSRGLRQRLALGLAIVHQPQVLLLDEPAAGLDPEARHSLSRLLVDLRTQGVTLVVSSHILAELEDYCTEMLILNDGRVVDQCDERARAERPRVYVVRVVGDKNPALHALAAMPAVLRARADGDRIVFECGADESFLADVLASLVKRGIAVSSFHGHAQDMQELYLAALDQTRTKT
jgi:ABC-2 type transport system ATP-binding protein